jgi:hypothetical protein
MGESANNETDEFGHLNKTLKQEKQQTPSLAGSRVSHSARQSRNESFGQSSVQPNPRKSERLALPLPLQKALKLDKTA